jgi:2,3-bisphosphoglycerate-independent phosphoglycerate mutase
VPFIIYDKKHKHELKVGSFGLANVAATIATLLDISYPTAWEKSMI